MDEFNKTFQPLQAFYRAMPNYRSVDGIRHPDEVHALLIQLFEEQA